jgi:hypothetical protein
VNTRNEIELDNYVNEKLQKSQKELEKESVKSGINIIEEEYKYEEITQEDKGLDVFIKIGNNLKVGEDQ